MSTVAAVEGKLGLLWDGREGRAWAEVPRKLPALPRLLPAAFRLHSEPTRLPGQHHGPWTEGSENQSPPTWKLAACLFPSGWELQEG